MSALSADIFTLSYFVIAGPEFDRLCYKISMSSSSSARSFPKCIVFTFCIYGSGLNSWTSLMYFFDFSRSYLIAYCATRADLLFVSKWVNDSGYCRSTSMLTWASLDRSSCLFSSWNYRYRCRFSLGPSKNLPIPSSRAALSALIP